MTSSFLVTEPRGRVDSATGIYSGGTEFKYRE